MSEIEQFPFKEKVRAPQKPSRRAYLLESLAIVLLAALAAYAGS